MNDVRVVDWAQRTERFDDEERVSGDGEGEGCDLVRGEFCAIMKDSERLVVLSWHIRDIQTTSSDCIYSPRFECAGYIWRAVLFPKGRSVSTHLAYYLELCSPSSLVNPLFVAMKVTLVNHNKDQESSHQEGGFIFRRCGQGGGFDRIASLAELYFPPSAWHDSTRDNSLMLVLTFRFEVEKVRCRRVTSVRVLTNNCIYALQKCGLSYKPRSIRVVTAGCPTFLEFKCALEKCAGIPLYAQDWFCLMPRPNGTLRFEPVKDLIAIKGHNFTMRKTKDNDLGATFYVRDCAYDQLLPEKVLPGHEIMLIFKYFDASRQHLVWSCSQCVPLCWSVEDLQDFLVKFASECVVEPRWKLQLYLERDPAAGDVVLLDPRCTLRQCHLQTGDIICYQDAILEGFDAGAISVENRSVPLMQKHVFASVDVFLHSLANTIALAFAPVKSRLQKRACYPMLVVRRDNSMHEITMALAEELGCDRETSRALRVFIIDSQQQQLRFSGGFGDKRLCLHDLTAEQELNTLLLYRFEVYETAY